jgi:hypothetical protein
MPQLAAAVMIDDQICEQLFLHSSVVCSSFQAFPYMIKMILQSCLTGCVLLYPKNFSINPNFFVDYLYRSFVFYVSDTVLFITLQHKLGEGFCHNMNTQCNAGEMTLQFI